jgi:hypothetical protein
MTKAREREQDSAAKKSPRSYGQALFGRAINYQRCALRITKQEIVDGVGVRLETVDRWLWGISDPQPPNRSKLLAFLRLSEAQVARQIELFRADDRLAGRQPPPAAKDPSEDGNRYPSPVSPDGWVLEISDPAAGIVKLLQAMVDQAVSKQLASRP